MNKHPLLLLAPVFFWCVQMFAVSAPAEAAWQPLFDGKTLSGWQASENPGGFRVADGAICFDGKRSHLFYTGPVSRADFKNFELRLEVKTQPQANSGLFFHTAYQEKNFPKQGFEVQIANTHKGEGSYVEMKKTGSLYGVRNIHKTLARDNEWFELHVVVRGKRIQVRVDGRTTVDYVEPSNPVADASRPGRRLSRGTFALQGHDPHSKVAFRNIRVRALPDELPDEATPTVQFDPTDERIVRLATSNYPLIDFHAHLKGGLTLEQLQNHMHRTGINYGVAANCGIGFPITDDAAALAFLESMKDQPFFVGMQAEGREWSSLFSPSVIARFDYVFTDGMTLIDPRGKRVRLWLADEVEVGDPQRFMEHLTATIETILRNEPIDIYVNPTFLPAAIAVDYDRLWTPERMERIIAAAKQNDVAIEINQRYRIPSMAFLRMAKKAGLKFTLGTNNGDAQLGRCEYGLEVIQALSLGYKDFWMPKPDGAKPIQIRAAQAKSGTP